MGVGLPESVRRKVEEAEAIIEEGLDADTWLDNGGKYAAQFRFDGWPLNRKRRRLTR